MEQSKQALAANIRFTTLLCGFSYIGLMILLVSYLLRFADQQATIYAHEFTPVFIIAFALMYQAFTAGEYFGMMRYNPMGQHSHQTVLNQFAKVSVSCFFVLMIAYYYLRAGFQEQAFEHYLLIILPCAPLSMLFYMTKKLKDFDLMPAWYYILKLTLLTVSFMGMLTAYIKLFFPNVLAIFLKVS